MSHKGIKAMDLKKEFSFDENLSNNGVWVAIGDGARVLVARMNNINYRKGLRRAVIPYGRRGVAMTEDQNREVLARMTARHLLLGWDNLSEDGQDLTYSEEEAYRLLTTYEEFFQVVVAIASDSQNYRTD